LILVTTHVTDSIYYMINIQNIIDSRCGLAINLIIAYG